ncbi:Dcp1p-Dcp2p decapping enzyme complex alpha subunit [Puccinia graminis f. sp. tritici]|uniref:Dcp1p-Dcp2p decapping enzyme complex alpha subunit n=1 Tax=Puccinia graminis f. sp. tritici TaxID=56615 RepID=A0A5B0LM22_PUCGR|nr:Dcp1p-Dcp2p decapping enzyme complex alpha subunit [Puccinia graminis f. sp. tritici]
MKFGLGSSNNLKESDSDNSERPNTGNNPETFESPESSPPRFVPPPAVMANPNNDQALQALQTQLSEMKAGFEAIVQQQNQTIANLANLATTRLQQPETPHNANSHADLMLRQFIKDPVQTHDRTNPQKPILAFDGSNYIEWEKAIDRTLQHAFVRDSPFIEEGKFDNFDALGIIEDKKVAELMRNTLHKDLLTIIESEGLVSAKDIFKSLREKCKRSGHRHKVILINRIIKFAGERLPASESWLARFCTIMTDVEQAKISINEFAGLLLQSLATAPSGVNSKNFEYSINQPLDTMSTVLEMVADNPPRISAIRWRIPASGCGCTLPPEILAGIRVSLGIPGAKRPHRREESLPASWFLNQLVGRGSSRRCGLCPFIWRY